MRVLGYALLPLGGSRDEHASACALLGHPEDRRACDVRQLEQVASAGAAPGHLLSLDCHNRRRHLQGFRVADSLHHLVVRGAAFDMDHSREQRTVVVPGADGEVLRVGVDSEGKHGGMGRCLAGEV